MRCYFWSLKNYTVNKKWNPRIPNTINLSNNKVSLIFYHGLSWHFLKCLMCFLLSSQKCVKTERIFPVLFFRLKISLLLTIDSVVLKISNKIKICPLNDTGLECNKIITNIYCYTVRHNYGIIKFHLLRLLQYIIYSILQEWAALQVHRKQEV